MVRILILTALAIAAISAAVPHLDIPTATSSSGFRNAAAQLAEAN